MYNGQYQVENDEVLLWKILVRDHSDPELCTPYMWCVPWDRCSPAFSVKDKNFKKVTNWSDLSPKSIQSSTIFSNVSFNYRVDGVGTTNTLDINETGQMVFDFVS